MYFNKKIILIVFSMQFTWALNAHDFGCTDTKANNYNHRAIENDGSCQYNETFNTPKKLTDLNNIVSETSGIMVYNGLIWTNNDSGGEAALYAVDPMSGGVLKKVIINGVSAIDWEDLAIDEEFVYIGDFGNNNGNRKDLRIIKFPLSELDQDTVYSVSVMTFKYEDQTDFTSEPQATNYDAESLMVLGDSLFVFSKNWKNLKSRIYALPKSFNNYSATVKDSISTNGLITGADFLKYENIVVLCGYNKLVQPFIYMFWDYKNNDFTKGNRRRINLNLPLRQIEGIVFNNIKQVYLSNESLTNDILNIKAAFYQIDLTEWIKASVIISIKDYKVDESIKLYPNPTKDWLNVEWQENLKIQNIEIISIDGKYSEVWSQNIQENKTRLDISDLNKGMYLLKLSGASETYFQRFIKN